MPAGWKDDGGSARGGWMCLCRLGWKRSDHREISGLIFCCCIARVDFVKLVTRRGGSFRDEHTELTLVCKCSRVYGSNIIYTICDDA